MNWPLAANFEATNVTFLPKKLSSNVQSTCIDNSKRPKSKLWHYCIKATIPSGKWIYKTCHFLKPIKIYHYYYYYQMASPQPERDLRDHTHFIQLPFTHLFHLTLFTPVAPKTGGAPPTFRPGPTLLPLTGLPLQSLFRSSSLFLPKKEFPLRHGGSSGSRGLPRVDHTDFLSMCKSPGVLLPPTLTPFWWTVESRCCLATLNAHHPSWFSRTEDDREAARGEELDGAINSS